MRTKHRGFPWRPVPRPWARLTLVLLAVTAGAALAAGESPVVLRETVAPLADLPVRSFAAVTAAELAVEDARRAAEGLPYRFALPVDLALTPDNAGVWQDLPGGRRLWRLRLRSPGALSLNLGCERFVLPPSALLHVYPAAAPERALRFDLERNADHDQLWTPVFLTDEIVVELEVAAAETAAIDLVVSHLGRGYRFFGEDPSGKSGSCNVDVVCPEGDAWRDEIDTVAMIAIYGGELCTGFMVNNTAADRRPLFMTASHCNVDAAAAATLVAYWNYQSPVCGQQGGGTKTEFSSGATLLARYATSDFILVELDEEPDPLYGVKYAGWNRSTADPDSAVCIHHPSTDEKSISFEFDPLTTTSYLSDTTTPGANHLRVADWDIGTTEGGSSGSPLFDPQHRVVGQLHGGRAGCGNDLPDWYGRLSTSWEGGGTPATRLRDHLDPLGSGVVAIDLLDPLLARFEVTPLDPAALVRVDGGAVTPGAVVFTVRNAGDDGVDYTVAVDVPWLDLDRVGGSLVAAAVEDVTVTPNAAALDLGLGTHTATLSFENPDTGVGNTTRAVVLHVQENALSVRGGFPNPFTRTPVEVRYTLRAPATVRAVVTDLRGLQVRDLGTFAGSTGENVVPWDGRDDQGRLAPSGQYVVAVEGLGQVLRSRVTFVH